MRLLQVCDHGSLTFTDDLGDNEIPKYAVLSHTWGASTDEVTYQDILNSSAAAASKVGFEKIRKCAEQAKRDGLGHIWVDTCCINKANFTELSEAINSMFKWYAKAEVCYAYLQDVSLNSLEEYEDTSSQEHLKSQLRSSRWFTRGWTLQELLAPQYLVLYSANWTRLGDKRSLLQVICEVTSIPATALQGTALEAFSIAERLSWQESRQTTREEDKAYSLFGICGVNLPLIYSEGQENAFRRLKNEIENVSKGAQREDFAVTFGLDVIGVERFVARQTELQEIRRILRSDGRRRTVIIHGLGGIGKTQLIIAYAKRYRNDYSAIFWLNAKDVNSITASFANIAQEILRDHPTAKELASFDLAESNADRTMNAVRAWLSLPGNTRWLLLFDNLDNPKLLGNTDTAAIDIRKFLPYAQQGFVVITTRSSRLDFGHQIELEKLQSSEDSLEILCDSSKRNISLDDPAANALLDKLDGLPLALATAGAYLRQSSMGLAEYLKWHDNAWAKLQQTSPGLLTYDRMLYSTWQVTFEQVNRMNHLSASLLRLWAYFDNQDVWYELLRHNEDQMWRCHDPNKTYRRPEWVVEVVKDKLTFEAAVRVLRDHGLVQPHSTELQLTESPGYSIHSCVHSWTRTVLNPGGATATDLAIFALKCVAIHVPYGDADRYWLTENRLLRHVLYAANGPLSEYPLGLAWTFAKMGRFCNVQGKQSEAMSLLEKAWQELEEASTDLHVKYYLAQSLGRVYRDQGDFSKATKLVQLAIRGFETIYGPQHHSVLDSMLLLANVHKWRAHYAEARDVYLRVLQAQEEVYGSHDSFTLKTVAICGDVHTNLGEVGHAERLLQRALRGLHRKCGPDHPDTLDAKYYLAKLRVKKGEYDVAGEMFTEALVARESMYGWDHPSVLAARHKLGKVHTNQQRWTESEAVLFRALRGYENCYGVHGRETLIFPVRSLGELYETQCRFVEAEEMYLRAAQGLESAFGLHDMEAAHAMYNLGSLYLKQEKLGEAEETLLRALKGYETAYGLSHVKTPRCPVDSLGLALRGLELGLRQSHKDTAAAQNRLGLVYKKLQRYEQAEQFFLLALEGYEFAYGPDHAATLRNPAYNLCLTYLHQAQAENAQHMYSRISKGRDILPTKDQESVDWLYDEIQRLCQRNYENDPAQESAIVEISNDDLSDDFEIIDLLQFANQGA